jgi:hypothetical protein
MFSIGDIIDRLVIENIKIFTVREFLHSKDISDKDYVENFNKMNGLNKNRSELMNCLDKKIENVISKKERNSILSVFKTY